MAVLIRQITASLVKQDVRVLQTQKSSVTFEVGIS